MATVRIYTKLSRAELNARLLEIPRIIAGRIPDRLGIARGFKLRVAVAWLEKIKLAFIVKARGGTDEAGISWPPLSKKYLAYGRGPKSTRTAGKKSPGGKDGFLTDKQLKRWQSVYARNLKWLAAREPLETAKGIAASIAWSVLKKEGAKTKLEVFGNRKVEILRDRGILFNSLSPGILNTSGPDASYSPPPDQVVQDEIGALIVGTNVAYANYHHNGKRSGSYGPHPEGATNRSAIRRQLWPDADQIPESWLEDIGHAASSGIPIAVEMIARGAA